MCYVHEDRARWGSLYVFMAHAQMRCSGRALHVQQQHSAAGASQTYTETPCRKKAASQQDLLNLAKQSAQHGPASTPCFCAVLRNES